MRFETGDVYQLAFSDDAFDVVHAHQVLQHLSDPVAALAEMRRVCRPGGVVAARDGDYGGFFWFPADPRTGRVAGAVPGRGPGAGRRTGRRAAPADLGPRGGVCEVEASGSAWCYTGLTTGRGGARCGPSG